MKAPLHRLASRLYAEPWLIRQDKYESLCQQFAAAAQGRMPDSLAMFDDEEVDAPKGSSGDPLAGVEISHGIALLAVDGIIGRRLSWMETLCGGYDIGTLQSQALALESRDDVDAVIIRFNTPGGAAAGVHDVATTLQQLGESKRTIAYVEDACSGGYYLAAACNEIYGGASCMVGSISAVCAVEDWSKRYEEEGVKVEVFKDGDLKGAGIPGTSLSEAQRADIQQRIEHIGAMFKGYVRSRRESIEDGTMRGQWFYGDEGLRLGLLDDLVPSLEECIQMALD